MKQNTITPAVQDKITLQVLILDRQFSTMYGPNRDLCVECAAFPLNGSDRVSVLSSLIRRVGLEPSEVARELNQMQTLGDSPIKGARNAEFSMVEGRTSFGACNITLELVLLAVEHLLTEKEIRSAHPLYAGLEA